jgi:pyridinium-3,5-bisthiocarboxylic acid mononucleotide nickel chelatase
VLVGESDVAGETPPGVSQQGAEELLMVETNVDDVSPQVLGHLLGRALEAGALDCYFTHVQMKKDRPGVLVSILCRPADGEAMHELLFAETPTLATGSDAALWRGSS